jgi:putative flippase GtrA
MVWDVDLTIRSPALPYSALRRIGSSRISRFAAIGIASTGGYALLFLALRPAFGATGANAGALALTAVANTAANRRITFGVRGREGLARQISLGVFVFVLALGVTQLAIVLMDRFLGRPSRAVEVAVLVAASALATAIRFVAFQSWVFASIAAPALPGTRRRSAADELRRRGRSIVDGRTGDPRWVRSALLAVLSLAAVLFLWNLTRDGYSNTYYAAAVKADK